jgi:CCR4-NOT transcriptional regulation complex NOT5 subunit
VFCPRHDNDCSYNRMSSSDGTDSKLPLEPIAMTPIVGVAATSSSTSSITIGPSGNDTKRMTNNDETTKNASSTAGTGTTEVEVVLKDEWTDRLLILRDHWGRYVRHMNNLSLTHHEHMYGDGSQWRFTAIPSPSLTRRPAMSVSASITSGHQQMDAGHANASLPFGKPHILRLGNAGNAAISLAITDASKRSDYGHCLHVEALPSDRVEMKQLNYGLAIWNSQLWPEPVGKGKLAFRTVHGVGHSAAHIPPYKC